MTHIALFKPMSASGGAFLACVGAGLIAFAFGPADLKTNLLVGAAIIGVVALIVISALRRILQTSQPTRAEIMLVWPPVAVELGILVWMTSFSGLTFDERTAWVISLAIVGVHFLPMVWSFGPLICGSGSCLPYPRRGRMGAARRAALLDHRARRRAEAGFRPLDVLQSFSPPLARRRRLIFSPRPISHPNFPPEARGLARPPPAN